MRVFIVGPRFHGYTLAMGAALEARGHDVSVCEYDRPDSFAARARNKALHDLPRALVPKSWADEPGHRAAQMLRAAKAEAVLVIKGDLLSERFWDELSSTKLPITAWFYDELRRMNFSPKTIAGFSAIATYSALDAQCLRAAGLEAHHLPLAFDSLTKFATLKSHEVTLIGARYPKREQLLRELTARGVPVRAFGQGWSRHPRDVLRSRAFRSPGVPSEPDLDRTQAYAVMGGSLATLNTHGDQDGFTMRTFEACGVGGLQLVDRDDCGAYYEPGKELLVFADSAEAAEHARKAAADPDWAKRIAKAGQRRTLAEHTFVQRMAEVEKLWANS